MLVIVFGSSSYLLHAFKGPNLLVYFLYLFAYLENALGLFVTSVITLFSSEFLFSLYRVCISLFRSTIFSSFSCLSVFQINCFCIYASSAIRLLFNLIILSSSSIGLFCLYKGVLAFLAASNSTLAKFSAAFLIFCTSPTT